MSDFSFMKTGFVPTGSQTKKNCFSEIEMENIEIMLGLFTTNAIKNASKYVKYCGRNGITELDINYGLKYEVFEFLKRPNILEEFKDFKNEMDNEDYSSSDDENESEDENKNPENDDIDTFSRISDENIENENKEFIDKFHNYYDTWDGWNPSTPLEKILKNAIDKTNY